MSKALGKIFGTIKFEIVLWNILVGSFRKKMNIYQKLPFPHPLDNVKGQQVPGYHNKCELSKNNVISYSDTSFVYIIYIHF